MYVNSNPSNVSWFSSSATNAPQMMGDSNGDMLKVLDACLINGYGAQAVISTAKNGEFVTFTTAPNHGYLERQYLAVSGATSAALNGKHRVASVTSDTVTIYVPAVTNTSGTISIKVAPLGWESVFGSTEPLKRAYRSKSTSSLKRILYLDMSLNTGHKYHATTPAKRAMVSVCTEMATLGDLSHSLTMDTDPTATFVNGSAHWYQKRALANTSAVPKTKSVWRLVGNGDFFYLLVGWAGHVGFDAQPLTEQFGFGQYQELMTSGLDTTFLMASYTENDVSAATQLGTFGGAMMGSSAGYGYNYASLFKNGARILCGVSPLSTLNTVTVSGQNGGAFPNAYGNSVFTLPCKIHEDTTVSTSEMTVVGIMPCMLYIDGGIGGGYDCRVLDDMVMIQVQDYASGTPKAGLIGFYLGD